MEPLISFCIATYNRKKKIIKLVNMILKCEFAEIEVVVVDDCSTDGTVDGLKEIKDARLLIYSNSTRQGANRNWFLSLSKGRGRYLFQLLDRDWINTGNIESLMAILAKEHIGFGYAGNHLITDTQGETAQYCVYSKGMPAARRFACVPVHPTGVIFSRKLWQQCHNRKSYFNKGKWGTYPHSYLFALMSQDSDGIRINIDICDRKRSVLPEGISRYYSGKSKNTEFWWTPKAHFHEFLLEVKMINKLSYGEYEKAELVLARYENELRMSTIEYRNLLKDRTHVRRYRIAAEDKGRAELVVIAFRFFMAVQESGILQEVKSVKKTELFMKTLYIVKLILLNTNTALP